MRTPGPWECHFHDHNSSYTANIYHDWEDGGVNFTRSIAVILKYGSKEENEANARYIVTACNAHDALVEALDYAKMGLIRYMENAGVRFPEETPIIESINKALALAKEA